MTQGDNVQQCPCGTSSGSFWQRGAPVFVWGAWLAMFVMALTFVHRYGINVPFAEDWLVVPAIAHQEPITLALLWEQHNSHRNPLAKVIYLGLAAATHGDFRAGMWFNVVAAAVSASLLIVGAKRLRGRSSYADAFFPLVLLHTGHWECFLFSFQIAFAAFLLLATTLLLLIACNPGPLTPAKAVVAGLCLVCLPLCGTFGVVFVPPLSLWLCCCCVGRWRNAAARDKLTSCFLLSLPGTAILLTCLYFVRLQTIGPIRPTLAVYLRGFCQVLVMSWGPAGYGGDAHSVVYKLVATATILLVLGTLAALMLASFKRSPERIRVFGFILFLVATLFLVFTVAWGRAALYETACLSSRYAMLGAPLLCCAFMATGMVKSRSLSHLAQISLLMMASAFLLPNMHDGSANGKGRHGYLLEFERDMRAGVRESALIEHHAAGLACSKEVLAIEMSMLQQAGIGPFRFLHISPDLARRPLRGPEQLWKLRGAETRASVLELLH